MIATILPGSSNFHAVGYNEHKVSKGVARLIEIQNFGSLGTFHKPTPSELVGYLQKYSSQNSRNRSFMWPYHVRVTTCRKKNCWILHTSISRKWDTENPVSRCLFTPIMTRRIPIFISSLREWHLMEERFSTAMSADVLRKSLTAFLGMTGRKKRKMTLICPSSTHSLHLPSSRQ